MDETVVDKANRVEGQEIRLDDDKTKEVCRCETFDRCNGRLPYGVDVWAGPLQIQARDCIAYSISGGIRGHRAQVIAALAQQKSGNPFYTNLKDFLGYIGRFRVLAFPPIDPPYIDEHIGKLADALYNTAEFNNFQKSMILRANLVRNGLVMRSDRYVDNEVKDSENNPLRFGAKELIPYCRGLKDYMWSIDHIQVRAKGGCNRFCNAVVLQFADNRQKLTNGPSCPCAYVVNVRAKVKEECIPGQDPFPYSANRKPPKRKPTYDLYECIEHFLARKEAEEKGETIGEIGGICDAAKLCNVDDPRVLSLTKEGRPPNMPHKGPVTPIYKSNPKQPPKP